MRRFDKEDFNELALFAGAGGGILGGRLLGWRIRCAVEIDPYCRRILLARQRDGIFPRFPVWDDVRTFDGRLWRGAIDVISGGFPCTDISLAGKGAGIEGKESGLWVEFARIIREVRPSFVFVENSPALTLRGIDRVLGDLATLGYDAEWGVFGAHEVGAPHKRDRIWIVAYADGDGVRDAKQWIARRRDGIQNQRVAESIDDGAEWNVADSDGARLERATEWCGEGIRRGSERRGSHSIEDMADSDGRMCDGGTKNEGREEIKRIVIGRDGGVGGKNWWSVDPADLSDSTVLHVQGRAEGSGEIEFGGGDKRTRVNDGDGAAQSRLGRVADGVADRVERLKAIGNGQVPEVARLAWDTLIGRVTG